METTTAAESATFVDSPGYTKWAPGILLVTITNEDYDRDADDAPPEVSPIRIHTLARAICLQTLADPCIATPCQVKEFNARQKLRQKANLEKLEQEGKLNENQKATLARLRA